MSTSTTAIAELTFNRPVLDQLLIEQGRRKDWLAARMGISPQRFAHCLAGRRRLHHHEAVAAAEALGVPIGMLVVGLDGPVTTHE